jgi:hypothetical protein
VGVSDGTGVASGRVVGAAVAVELLVVVAGDALQPASKHRLRTTNTGTERGFIRCLQEICTSRRYRNPHHEEGERFSGNPSSCLDDAHLHFCGCATWTHHPIPEGIHCSSYRLMRLNCSPLNACDRSGMKAWPIVSSKRLMICRQHKSSAVPSYRTSLTPSARSPTFDCRPPAHAKQQELI